MATHAHAGERLASRKEHVISAWEARVREDIPTASRESHLILVDTLPAILDQFAEALSPESPRQTATEGSSIAAEHGGERVRVTHFRLEDVVTEYKLLREVLFETLERDAPLSTGERRTLNSSVDQALSEACTGYALVSSSARDQIFAILAHDLRTPLSVAQTTANLILTKPDADELPSWAARIVENLGRVDRMLQDLLDGMRMESGARLQLELRPCDLVEIVCEAIERLRPAYGDRFRLDAGRPVHGYFDPDALGRAITNLATNAVKYGSTSHEISVKVRAAHGRALMTIHNDGQHIPVEEQETLFRAFQRATVAEADSGPGWGLGLAQVRAAVEAHGGSIGVDSALGRGTTFTIDIPSDARLFQHDPARSRARGTG
jgi:signal transduction histidine kinase